MSYLTPAEITALTDAELGARLGNVERAIKSTEGRLRRAKLKTGARYEDWQHLDATLEALRTDPMTVALRAERRTRKAVARREYAEASRRQAEQIAAYEAAPEGTAHVEGFFTGDVIVLGPEGSGDYVWVRYTSGKRTGEVRAVNRAKLADFAPTAAREVTASTRVEGHARKVVAANTRQQGMFTIADSWTSRCGCGEYLGSHATETSATRAHTEHKAAVLAGTFVPAGQAEDPAVVAEREAKMAAWQAEEDRKSAAWARLIERQQARRAEKSYVAAPAEAWDLAHAEQAARAEQKQWDQSAEAYRTQDAMPCDHGQLLWHACRECGVGALPDEIKDAIDLERVAHERMISAAQRAPLGTGRFNGMKVFVLCADGDEGYWVERRVGAHAVFSVLRSRVSEFEPA